MRKNEVFRFGVREFLSKKFGGNNLHSISELSESEYLGCTNRETYYISRNKPPQVLPYKLITCKLIQEESLIIGITSGIPNMIVLSNRAGFPLVMDDLRLHATFVQQLIVSTSTGTVIIAGSGVDLYDFSISRGSHAMKPDIRVELRVSIPSESFGSRMCRVYFDEKRKRILVPTLTGYRLYGLNGALLQSADRLSPIPFRTACCIHWPDKACGDVRQTNEEETVLNPFKRFLASDGDGVIRLWHPSGKLFQTFPTPARSFVFTEFIDTEFVICISNAKSVLLLDIKTGKILPLLDLPQLPDYV